LKTQQHTKKAQKQVIELNQKRKKKG